MAVLSLVHVFLRMSGLCLRGDPWSLARGTNPLLHTQLTLTDNCPPSPGFVPRCSWECQPPLLRAGMLEPQMTVLGWGTVPTVAGFDSRVC